MMSWTPVDAVLDTWIGENRPTDRRLVERWIAQAERRLRAEFPDLRNRLSLGQEPDLLGTIQDVVSAMVTRVFRNPDGVRQRNETTGGFTGSVTFAGNTPGMLELTDAEKDSLKKPGVAKTGQAFSLDLIGNTSTHGSICSSFWGGRCSCGAGIAGKPIFGQGG